MWRNGSKTRQETDKNLRQLRAPLKFTQEKHSSVLVRNKTGPLFRPGLLNPKENHTKQLFCQSKKLDYVVSCQSQQA